MLLLLVGVLGMLAGVGVLDSGPSAESDILIAAAAIPTAVGAALLAPAVLALAGRTAPRLALPLRYAVPDADRQRSRTAPAVAAITATVAGLVAVGTAASSSHTAGRLHYQPSGPHGVASVAGISPDNLDAALGVVRRVAPEATVHQLSGVSADSSSDSTFREVRMCRPEPNGVCQQIRLQSAPAFGIELLVGAGALTALGDMIDTADRQRGRAALARGQVLMSGEDGAPSGPIRLQQVLVQVRADGNATEIVLRQVDATTARLAAQPQAGDMGAATILPEALARQLGSVSTVALVVGPGVTRAQDTRLTDELQEIDNTLYARAELRYDERTPFAVVALAVVAALVVLGGTLVATSLALVEARPDLAILTAVGARPRSARAVAGAYALVLALLGTALGIGAGLIPGIAVSIPLTRMELMSSQRGPGYVVDVPWLMLTALLVLVPLVAAGAAAASRRQPAPGGPAA